MVSEENKMIAIRKFPPGTKFISLFGAPDTVSEKDDFIFSEDGDILVLGVRERRLIYTPSSGWANTENE
jgi:hypothetical protein